MTMQIKNDNKLLTPGDATYIIEKAWDKDKAGNPLMSKAGNLMYKLKLNVTDTLNDTTEVWDYVVLSSDKKILSLLSSIADPTLIKAYQNNQFSAQSLEGKKGKCSIKTDNHEIYGTKTVIGWYLEGHVKDESVDNDTSNNERVPLNAYNDISNQNDSDDYPF